MVEPAMKNPEGSSGMVYKCRVTKAMADFPAVKYSILRFRNSMRLSMVGLKCLKPSYSGKMVDWKESGKITEFSNSVSGIPNVLVLERKHMI